MKNKDVLQEKKFSDAKRNLEKINEIIKPFSKKGQYKEVSTYGKWKPEMDSSLSIKKP